MISLDIDGASAKAITPSKGIPDSEYASLQTGMKRYIEEWLHERESGEHQWSMIPYDRDLISATKEAARRIHSQKIQTVIWIGIGGSGLGPKVIQEAFETIDTLEFIVLDTIDPYALERLTDMVDWKKAMVIVTSKSGGTLEPMSTFFYCLEQLRNSLKPEKLADRVLAITDPDGGILHDFCVQHGFPMLPIAAGVGGRYSIFTPVGLLPLALLDGNIDEFIRGAKEIDTICQTSNLFENPAALLAVTQFLLDTKRGYNVRVIMPYSQRLASISRWNQQLIAESLGKNELQNPIPLAALGTQDQHSLLQQWREGPRKCWHLFIREVDKPRITVPTDIIPELKYLGGKTFSQLFDACYEGTRQALSEAKRPHVSLSLARMDEYHLGQLFFLFMIEVVFLGKLYRIDPYGQPGVELGKTITKDLLSRGQE